MAVNMAAVVLLLSSVLPYVAPERIEDIFKDVVSVVESERALGRLKSTINIEDSISMLMAAAVVESGLRQEVETCKLSGDGGRSIGLGQVMRGQNWEGHTREEICSDRMLQLQLSLHVIDRCWGRTPRPDYAFRCYASGDAAKKSHTATRESRMFSRVKMAMQSTKKVEDKPGAKLMRDGVSSYYVVHGHHPYLSQRYSQHHAGSRVRLLRGGRHHVLHRSGGRQIVPRGSRGRFRR